MKYFFIVIFVMITSGSMANSNNWLVYGNRAMQAQNYRKAISYYTAALKQDRRNARAALGLGTAYLKTKNTDKALGFFQYALRLQPANIRLKKMIKSLTASARPQINHFALGLKFLKQKNFSSAIFYLRQATQKNPQDPRAWRALGNAYYGTQEIEKSITAWRQSLILRPDAALRAYVDQIHSNTPKNIAAKTKVPNQADTEYNPWLMGGLSASLVAFMLFIF